VSTTEVVLVDRPADREAVAVAGFLAGYCGATRRSYTTDLRLFVAWCHQRKLTLFDVRRTHL
jgi:integrase/recombinase XerD